MYYTLGQRKGLGIGGIAGEKQDRWYVIDKDLTSNELVVSCGEGEELFSKAMTGGKLNIIGAWDKTTFECTAKFRYRQPDQEVCVRVKDDTSLHIEFAEKQRAVTEGQYAVLYQGENCLGGGVIESAEY